MEGGHTERNADDRRHDDADDDRALDVAGVQRADHDEADKRDDRGADQPVQLGIAHLGEVDERHEGGRVGDHETRVLKPDEREEEADTGADRSAHTVRDRLDDRLAEADRRDEDKQDAGDEDDCQRLSVGITHGEDHRVGEEGVEPHAGRLRKGDLRVHRHQEGAEEGDQAGCKEYAVLDLRGVFRLSHDVEGVGEHGRVDDDDVRHRHEGREAGQHLGLHVGVVLFELKIALKEPLLFCLCH